MLKTVVVIDDNDSDLLFSRIMLERTGTIETVLTFESAIDALDFFAAGPRPEVDLVLLDINMPEMTGFEFLEAYEALHPAGRPAPKVVMLTSSPDPRDRERALAYGSVNSYTTKPIDRVVASGLGELLSREGGPTP